MKKKEPKTTVLGQDLIEAAKAMVAHARGEEWTKDFITTTYMVPDKMNVKKIRTHIKLTQEQFAKLIGASVHAIRHWENGRRKPEGPARRLLQVLQANPRAVLDALG